MKKGLTVKQWKKFEEIVAEIEHKMAPAGAVVKSPDVIPDVRTGSPIKVDGSIRFKVGSSEVLIVLECRDRSRVQEVAWIRELLGRKTDTGASNLIGISSTGFTPEAARKAKDHGITLRKLRNVTSGELLDLSLIIEARTYRTTQFTFTFFETLPNAGEVFLEEYIKTGLVNRNCKICKTPSADVLFTPLEIFDSLVKLPNKFLDNASFNEKGESPWMTLQYPFGYGECIISSSKGDLYAQSLTVKFRFINKPPISLASIARQTYTDYNSKALFDTYTFGDGDANVQMDFDHLDPSSTANAIKFDLPIEIFNLPPENAGTQDGLKSITLTDRRTP